MNENQDLKSQLPPPNYLVWAIVSTIICCIPFGIVSIIYASQVNSKWEAGDSQGALLASKNAKLWAWITFIAGIVVYAGTILLTVFGVIAGLGIAGLDF